MSESPPRCTGDRMHLLTENLAGTLARMSARTSRRFARRAALLITALIGAALLLSACDLIDNEDDEQEAQQQQEEQAAEPAAPAAEPTRAAPPPTQFDATTVYSIIRASLARVEVERDGVMRSITGLVTRDGRIITDGAIVDGAASIAVVLSNGDRIEDISVEAVDYASGLASIGPIGPTLARRLPAVSLGDGERLQIGSAVYAVGFTAGGAADASISAGLLSSRAEWAAAELTIFSTDASIPFNQAGMVLADEMGAVIGVASWNLAQRGRFISSSDLARQIAMLPADGAMADDEVMMAMEAMVLDIEVMPGEQTLAFMTAEDAGSRLSVTVSGLERGMVTVLDATGATVDSATVVGGGADTVVVSELGTVGPYQVWLSTEAMEPTSYAVQSEQMVGEAMVMDFDDRPWNPEDASSIGLINPDGDVDVFSLPAMPGDVYEVRVESLTIDVYLYATGAGLDLTDDDGLGGLSGTDAMLRLEPTERGELQLVVGSIDGAGGYMISVEQLEVGSAPVVAATPAAPVSSSFPAFPDPPAIAMRGTGNGLSLTTTAVSRGYDAGDEMLAVTDADGLFDVTTTIFAAGGATARILITRAADGQLVHQSTLTAACPPSESCTAVLISNPLEAEGGEWIVSIEHGGSGSVDQWQVEVATND